MFSFVADPLATAGVALASLSDSGLSDTGDEGFDHAWKTIPDIYGAVDDLFGAGLPSRSRSRSPHRLNDICNADGAAQDLAGDDVASQVQNWTLDDSDASSVGPPTLFVQQGLFRGGR